MSTLDGAGAVPLANALAQLLPTADETLFLRACVDRGPAGASAWRTWRSRHSLAAELERGRGAFKHLVPVLAFALEQSRADLEPSDLPVLRAARLREGLRSQKYCEILLEALAGLGPSPDALLLKGEVLSQTVYPAAGLRHSHDIDVLIRGSDLERAVAALRRSRFQPQGEAYRQSADDRTLVHSSGLPLELHTSLFAQPTGTSFTEQARARRVQAVIETGGEGRRETRVQTLARPDALVHVLGHGFDAGPRGSLMWVSDAYFLIHNTPALDWGEVSAGAVRAQRGLALYLTLRYLRSGLDVPVPVETIGQLQSAAQDASYVEYGRALSVLRRSGRGGYRRLLAQTGSVREGVILARWMVRRRNLAAVRARWGL